MTQTLEVWEDFQSLSAKQDVKVRTGNIRFLKEKYYLSCKRQTCLADLPAGYAGEFGPEQRATTRDVRLLWRDSPRLSSPCIVNPL